MLLSEKDKKDLNKFIKYFIFKCVQVIIQSRNGKRVKSKSKLIASGSDWFNLLIREEADISNDVKKVHASLGPDGFKHSSLPITVEFCLKVKPQSFNLKLKEQNNRMARIKEFEEKGVVVECWEIWMDQGEDQTVKVSFGVYNRLTTLLKNLFILTRATPLYKITRLVNNLEMQSRITAGRSSLVKLKGAEKKKVGLCPSPSGTIHLDVFYNTKALKQLSNIVLLSDNITLEIIKDHFSNDFYQYTNEDDDEEEEEDIISVTKDEKGNVIIKNLSPIKTNKTTNKDFLNNNTEKALETQENTPTTNTNNNKSQNNKIEINSTSPSSKTSAFQHIDLDQFNDPELKSFFKQFKEAEKLNIFSNHSTDDSPVAKVDDVYNSLTTTLAQFEQESLNFDQFIQSIDHLPQ